MYQKQIDQIIDAIQLLKAAKPKVPIVIASVLEANIDSLTAQVKLLAKSE